MGDDRFPRAMVPESKYPPDTLHLSLLNPRSSTVVLHFLTTDASPRRTEGRTEKRERERERERGDDRSSGMPVVAIEKLLIRDARQEIQFRGSLIVQQDVDRYTDDVDLALRQPSPCPPSPSLSRSISLRFSTSLALAFSYFENVSRRDLDYARICAHAFVPASSRQETPATPHDSLSQVV